MTQFKLEDLAAPEGTKPSVENRASKLVGFRLEKHLEKLRGQYKAQKDEEETKRQFYHSPGTAHRDGIEAEGSVGEESSEGLLEGSAEISSNFEPTPERSPGPSPALNLREMTDVSAGHPPSGQRVPPKPATKPKVAPQVAPRSAGHSTPQVNGGHQPAYNPYPPPSQPAPPSPHQVERLPSPQQPAPAPPQPIVSAPPVVPPSAPPSSPGTDKEALFAFAWYHGSIPRDEALRRLEGVGGFDGAYLVRDSTTVNNSYVLTMYAKLTAKNFQILPVDNPNGPCMYRIDDGPGFPTIDLLLRHYKQDSDRLPCRLTQFCPRPPTRMTEC